MFVQTVCVCVCFGLVARGSRDGYSRGSKSGTGVTGVGEWDVTNSLVFYPMWCQIRLCRFLRKVYMSSTVEI